MKDTSMDFTSFTQAILKNLQVRLGENYSVFSHSVKKNNGMKLTGIVAKRKEHNASPTFYIDDFYREGLTQEEIRKISDLLYERFQAAEIEDIPDLSGFISFDKAKEKLAFKLIHAEKNEELLKDVPHKLFYNLAMVPYYTVWEAPFYGKAAILVYNSHVRQWGISEEILFETIFENTPLLFPSKIENMQDVICSILMEELKEKELFDDDWIRELADQMLQDNWKSGMALYVLSNKQKLYGAACMLYPGVLAAFARSVQQDLYVLPSSVHEVILVPANDKISKEALHEIVTDINRTQVAEDEVLADSIYYYSRNQDKLLWIS